MGGGLEGLLGLLAGGQGGAQGLGSLVDRLRQAGLGEEVDSWVGTGANKPVAPERLESAFGPDTLAGLAQQFGGGSGGATGAGGMAGVLAAVLPQLINGLTPQGRVPQRDEEFGAGGVGGMLAQMMGGQAGGAPQGGGGLGALLGGLMGGGSGGAAPAAGGLGAMLGALMGGAGGTAPSAPEPQPGGKHFAPDQGGPLPQKPRPLG
ncbi:hypothetical protein Rmf_24230 [Roseomonas fluvialis]|uniref:DUF937 domain-containing protein n=2 Tax=Roseomonas fluvialis TaxID=1750527 RepID=A0ABN6P1M7_9PROT|nr:hypothetical protein Rmf_24230 [Roseomonas fluvialis]